MSKTVKVGTVTIGGGNPVSVQSMTNTKTVDTQSTLEQIERLAGAGCEIVRVSVPDNESAVALKSITLESPLPVVADIHFDYRLAIESIRNGAAKVRINPGNFGQEWKIVETVKIAKEHNVPIRVGANSGSIDQNFSHLCRVTALAESALAQVRLLEKAGFEDIIISVKASSVSETVEATRYVSEKVDYPLHLGVTEAGFGLDSIVKSSIGIGALLLSGIGDTIRVSISGDPIQEVEVAFSILKALNLRPGPDIISCPTCARTEINVEKLAREVKQWLKGIDDDITVAIMGCVVNGLGEGKEADIGIAGTRTGGVIFMKGRIVEQTARGELEERFKYWLDKALCKGEDRLQKN
ncbi:MAG TPA: flavodoxin-dependent (E)-4-hydroxy-3-methylbut-2-enyl-diphosphate synthase [Mesotoga infera]|jgi:(E)-4-hydroxy-3-methylbut-2-enyl-diphosphate synthase|nr:flavodoxin-dependent (E)-4-hydroxy-3-methylbut-2-enyl-diphosphate synthase [Mesotoga sp.]NLI06601.1 flavodoxin-dependent (E)-4-hydroxy-3-methylbut-2-enyl-diphosphate synthase [Thermotogaceae bacterium]HNS67814.1 flavodoxin-dependent (E)-4-hydroxy-3-methylbut-2-enyl-diphosphate synthase [Mesotoga infera]HOI33643.1 flavodoxin-dependent (E)-4-hydroxy-3-methylbut-2-enyl-diphosphate synthase [Mesotoga infera]HON26919.1 flavodoxin-dependent (E)-4-hydroxy-3-methylbut-2-enyl-diphosphate synthase [Me